MIKFDLLFYQMNLILTNKLKNEAFKYITV